MSKPKTMDSRLRDQVWSIAASVEWSEADWRDFYKSLTAVFARIAARHAKSRITQDVPQAAQPSRP
jgi:hypothetical protein